MPITHVEKLIKKYASKLINNTITDDELDTLLQPGTFTKSMGYVDPVRPVTDSNHTVADAIKVFVFKIAPKLGKETLYSITQRLIDRARPVEKNAFLRNSTLEKYFLAYALTHNPETKEIFFASERIKTEFSLTNPVDENSTQVINIIMKSLLSIIIDFFKSPDTRFKEALENTIIPENDEEEKEEDTIVCVSTHESIAAVAPPSTRSFPILSSLASSFSAMFRAKIPEEPSLARFIAELKNFVAHYSSESVQNHEKYWYPQRVTTKNITRSFAKALVAEELTIILNTSPVEKLQTISATFLKLLNNYGMSSEDFFIGKTMSYLSEDLRRLLVPPANHLTI